MAETPLSWKARCEGGARARSSENTTSSALKGAAVVELHARPQLEAPACGRAHLPGQRQRGLEPVAFVAADQRFVDLEGHARVVQQRHRMRVQRLRVEGRGDAQVAVGGCWAGACRGSSSISVDSSVESRVASRVASPGASRAPACPHGLELVTEVLSVRKGFRPAAVAGATSGREPHSRRPGRHAAAPRRPAAGRSAAAPWANGRWRGSRRAG
jgi:hypothetical protein